MDKYVLFAMKDAMLFVRYMLVCMCVCVSLEYKCLDIFLIRLRHRTQRWEANLRVGQSWVPNTFLRAYPNPNSGSKIKGPSSKGCYIHGS